MAFLSHDIGVDINWLFIGAQSIHKSLKSLQHGCQALASQMLTFLLHMSALTGAEEQDKDTIIYIYSDNCTLHVWTLLIWMKGVVN